MMTATTARARSGPRMKTRRRRGRRLTRRMRTRMRVEVKMRIRMELQIWTRMRIWLRMRLRMWRGRGSGVDAGARARSTTLRRGGLLSPASAARIMEEPQRRKGFTIKAEPRPAPGEQAPRGIPRERDLARAERHRGGRGGGRQAVLAAGTAPPRQTGERCHATSSGASPVGAAHPPPTKY